jgi:FkbM family methyltransferase
MNFRRRLAARFRVAKGAGARHHQLWNLFSLATFALQRRILPDLALAYPVFGSTGASDVSLRVRSAADVSVFWEVFAEGEYRDLPLTAPKVILDAGGNVGFAAIYFAARYPKAIVHSLEPDPHNFALLEQNVASYPNIRAHRLALAAHEGPLELHVNPRSRVSTSIVPRPGSSPLQVAALTLDAFLARERITSVDLLKFDIEGAEFDVFRASRELHRIERLIGEFHGDLAGVSFSQFAELLSDYDVQSTPLGEVRRLVRAVRRPSPA